MDLPYVERRGLPAVQADVSHFDDMLQLSRLFFHFGGKEEGSKGNGITMKPVVGVEHVKTLSVNNGRVDT